MTEAQRQHREAPSGSAPQRREPEVVAHCPTSTDTLVVVLSEEAGTERVARLHVRVAPGHTLP